MIAVAIALLLAQKHAAPAAKPAAPPAPAQGAMRQSATPQSAPLQPTPLAPTAPAQTAPPEPPKIAPWQGTLSAGRTELQELSNAGEHEKAVELGARMLAMEHWDQLPEELRADTFFDIGVALGAAKQGDLAAETFHKARGLAGSKPLGLDALYDAGTYRLQGAEELRQQIPEIRQKLGLQPLPQAAQPLAPAGPKGQPAPKEQAPDALATARAAYLAARGDLVERLRSEASDRDTRANLELIQRRLRELDELQKKREEEEKKKQEQQNKDKKDDQQKQDDKQQQDKDKQDPQNQDQQNQDQQDKDKQDQQKQDQQDKDKQQKDQQQPKPDEQKQDDKDQKQSKPDPKDQQEMQPLSPEEVVRLLDQLQKIEEQAEQVRAQIRERRRVPVKKDW